MIVKSRQRNTHTLVPLLAILVLSLSACTVVKQGEAGVQRTLGRYENTANTGGIEFYNPFTSSVIKIPIRTENVEVHSKLP